MEDEERQKKLEAGKAKLAEYRQRKAYADSQKKQKKKKKKKPVEDAGGDSQGTIEVDQDQLVLGEEVPAGGLIRLEEGDPEPPTTEYSFARTLRSGETVKHDQTYTIEPESEVSTTAEDYSSEDEVEPLHQVSKGHKMQDMEEALAAKTQAVEELSRELEQIRTSFGTEGVQQLQDFEAALKQRDGIITQLTANLQQAREEKDEIMREFLEMTEQSQKLHIQFQQLQAGETLRNTSHSSTAADLLQARQQLVQSQQQLEELGIQLQEHQERSSEQLLEISRFQQKLDEMELAGRRSEESFAQKLNEKDLLIEEKEIVMLGHQQSLTALRAELVLAERATEESFAQKLGEKDLLISEQTAIITDHEQSLTLLREELVQVGQRKQETDVQTVNEKDMIIAEQERVISERDGSLTQLEDELESSGKRLNDLYQRITSKELELERCLDELESTKVDLQSCKGELQRCRVELEKEKKELENCQGELITSKQKERMSSNEIMQLMGTVEDLQKRNHQGSMSEGDIVKKMEAESARNLECLRAELDEMYGQQIVQMKHELNLQHATEMDRIIKQHSEQELNVQQQSQSHIVDKLNAEIRELEERLQESDAIYKKARHELNQFAQEKLNLQAQVVDLLQDLRFAEEKVEMFSQNLENQENKKSELQRLQDTIDDLKRQLAAAEEAALEEEVKHESETTNYKIKLEMLEREKDAVLDRMAESQEAELERLRTQLLFSHEEELTHLREGLQRESFLNTENLLNEASIKHERALGELRITYEEELRLLGREKASFATERDELLHQIFALKEDLKLALHSSKADELVLQLQELQVEVGELRKGGDERAKMERELNTLLTKTETLEKQTREKEECWKNTFNEQESEKHMLIKSNSTLIEDIESKNQKIEFLTSEKNQVQQQAIELKGEIEKQKTTFSFAEKNFEVNYQELKEEYTCLTEAKAQLEERTLKETLEFEAKIVSLQSQIRELKESSANIKMEAAYTDSRTLIEKDTSELMEKLSVISSEKETLIFSLSKVTDQLTSTEGKLEQLKGELIKIQHENNKVMAQNKSLKTELDRERGIMMEQKQKRGQDAQSKSKLQQGAKTVEPEAKVCSIEDHYLQIESLRGEVKALQSLLQAAEVERDSVQHVQRLSHTPSPLAVQYSGEGPVEGRSSPQKPTAPGSSRRKRRQKSKQERKSGAALQGSSRDQSQREEEEEGLLVEEEEAVIAAEPAGKAQMESRVASRSNQRDGEKDFTEDYQGDRGRDYINKQVRRGDGLELVVEPREEDEERTTEHGECRLQLAAQHISLSQIHAAQMELLREQTDAHTHTLEMELKNLKGQDEPNIFKSQSLVQAVSEECNRLILSLSNIFGEGFSDFAHQTDAQGSSDPLVEKQGFGDSSSMLFEAQVLCRDLGQAKEKIEQEHERLSQLQAQLRADGNKMMAMQTAYDELKRSAKEIGNLREQVGSRSTSAFKDLGGQTGPLPDYHSEAMERLKAEAQEKQLQLEERHRQEVERLRTYYQHQASETEERYTTELIVLEQRLQEVTGTQTQFSSSGIQQCSSETLEKHAGDVKRLDEEEDAEEEEGPAAEQRRSARSAGLTTQLQTLRKALYNKYVQEVSTLKEQHNAELRRLREGREQGRDGGGGGEEEEEEDDDDEERGEGGVAGKKGQERGGVSEDGRPVKGPEGGGRTIPEEKRYWEQVEEEVAKVIVQMSVEFAQRTELARLGKRSCQTSTSIQTQSEEDEAEETPAGSSPIQGWRMEDTARERLERELRERAAEVAGLKQQLWKTESGPEQVLQTGAEEDEEGIRKFDGGKVSSQDGREFSCLDIVTAERNLLLEANARLRQVLADVLKTTAAAEETMGLHMESLRQASNGGQLHAATPQTTWQRVSTEPFKVYTAGPLHGGETGVEDDSVWSRETETDEGLESSQQLTDRLMFMGAETQLENQELLMGISVRLQTALERMLVAISDTTNQLEHARVTQTELMRESFRHNQEMGELLQRQEELQERLAEEARAREQLALELHRAEGLIDGYTGERAALEERLQQKEELQLNLEQELQVTGSRLQELEQERLQMQQERELLTRQKDAMREQAGPRELRLVEAAVVAAPEADLLEETEKLMKEKVEVQRQAEKENSDLLKHMKLLEAELEEQVNRVIELEQAQRTESGDLRQQIQALEKQLENNRRFLDEQAVDREHERDVFQQEIQKLEKQLKNPQKGQAGSEQRNQEVDGVILKVDQLTSQLKEKADWCSELLLGSEQLRRELSERDQEIDKLESRIHELEQALLASAESLEKVQEKKQHASISEAGHSALESQLQTEREALDRKEKEISNLEEQLEQFREELENKSEEVQQLNMQLEIQGKELSSQQQYLETRDSMVQVMEEKDREIELLNEQITKLQHMETASDNKEMDQRDELIRDLESQVECMRSEQERLKRNSEEELDQLNAVIDRLQQELANIEQKQATEEEEDIKGQLESPAGAGKEEYNVMKQRMDLATEELNMLRMEHSKLLEIYRRLKESAEALAETEQLESSEAELEEALREKTAGLVVMQAQVQALEQSATSRVEELGFRIQELENLVSEKDSELARCRLLVGQAQNDAETLQQKVSNLEDKLREMVAAALVSQAQVKALQQESQDDHKTKGLSQEPKKEEPRTQAGTEVYDLGDFYVIPQMGFSQMTQSRQGATGKVVHLTEKLRQLEVGLSGMQKDQELQKQLLSSSEEEVLEYERRLAVLMDLLNQMKTKAISHQRTLFCPELPAAVEQSAAAELLQELQEVRDEAQVTKEQLESYKESCSRLQEQLEEKGLTVGALKEQLEMASSRVCEEAKVSELQVELLEVQKEAAVTKEELCSCRESFEKLQELLQEREMTIAHLKGELFRVTADEEGPGVPELLQELQEVRNDAVATKEELTSYRECTEKLQDELHTRDLSIAKLKEELQELRTSLAKAAESAPVSPSLSPSPQPPPSSSTSTTQPKRKGGKLLSGKGGSAKDKPSLSRKNSAAFSQSSEKLVLSPGPGSDSQQRRVSLTDSFTQTEDFQASAHDLDAQTVSAVAKEDVEEVVRDFQDKIVQMQELHAAEILDMEARHISESETLRRDTQALEDECKALKAVIIRLRSAEAHSSRIERLTSSQFKDGYTSDSSSDYSQRTGYDPPNLQQEFRTTPDGARRDTDDPLPDRIKSLLREVHQEGMQVLSLSEVPLAEGQPGGQPLSHGWNKERDALLATVESLKSLITQMQTQGGVDYRMELLGAVQQVFIQERGVLKSALYSQLDLLDTSDAIIHLNQLEQRLTEQDAQHREAMESLHTADRSSLISEIHQLRCQLEQLQQGLHSSVPVVAESSCKEQRERGVAGPGPGTGPGPGGAADSDRLLVEELKGELAQTKLELETTLRAQHKHLKELDTLRAEVSQKAAEVDSLTDHLSEERKRSRELQWVVEKDKCKTGRSEESKREELEDLRLALEEQQSRVAQLSSALEQEHQASSQLAQQVDLEQLNLHRRLQELQVQLETERAKALELSSVLGRERELRTRTVLEADPFGLEDEDGEEECRGQLDDEGTVLRRLQRDLDEKHTQVVELLSEIEAQKLEAVRQQEELTVTRQRSKRDLEALQEALDTLGSLEVQLTESRVRLERESKRSRSLQEDKQRLEDRVAQLRRLSEGKGSRPLSAGDNSAACYGDSTERTKDWVFEQKSSATHGEGLRTGHAGRVPHGPWHTSDNILGKLHLIASKISSMATKTTDREITVDSDELTWMQSNIDEVIAMLQQSAGLPTAPESASLRGGGSASTSSSLTERLLRQNAELTGFVSRLTEEKNDLRNQTLRLGEELRRCSQAGPGTGDGTVSRRGASRPDSAGVLLSQERELWGMERLRLEAALRGAQAQVARLRGEIRADALRDVTGPEANSAALRRMYGKYLRSESFRKALIYQKKYLLLLLGGFQECEEATLSLISRMGGRPSLSGWEALGQRRRGLTRFRSAVRVSIALSRMRFLVKRWQKTAGGGILSPGSVGKNGVGHTPGLEVKDSPFLHPGSVEVYRERGGVGGGGGGVCSSRGRSGRDSPRSAMSSTPHRFHVSGDPGPLSCSHLQNYDPDRALTDYISRLEALQRRLGSVTSGSSSYTQLHFGLRR